MNAQRLLNLSAVRKQHLLVEFSSLKYACPDGVFVSLTPGDPTLWSGVIFVRSGPYAKAILRFQISFPPSYPNLPPLVTFSTDMFHPLITPLTTYMYTTDIHDTGTVSATDDERLPPGGFSLRHGFPGWFGRGSRGTGSSIRGSGQSLQTPSRASGSSMSGTTSDTGSSESQIPGHPSSLSKPSSISTYDVLRYIRSTFDDGTVLDDVPLEAAGNPGAWHAWKKHRVKSARNTPTPSPRDGKAPETIGEMNTTSQSRKSSVAESRKSSVAKEPGEWNWDGVWEIRVKKGIENSLLDPILYGNAVASGDDLIRFLNIDEDHLGSVKENMIHSIENS